MSFFGLLISIGIGSILFVGLLPWLFFWIVGRRAGLWTCYALLGLIVAGLAEYFREWMVECVFFEVRFEGDRAIDNDGACRMLWFGSVVFVPLHVLAFVATLVSLFFLRRRVQTPLATQLGG
ncbi:MAG TPA: hypothetical protein VIU42_08920 [Xanthobacteraceae bacterium]|jgi:hypothetical protein